jgi:hypothetical protein
MDDLLAGGQDGPLDVVSADVDGPRVGLVASVRGVLGAEGADGDVGLVVPGVYALLDVDDAGRPTALLDGGDAVRFPLAAAGDHE